ncbi:hypothetical protein JBO39_05265 [Serratia marcescens]|nr:hypothetical protein [Serratia marcescens]MBL5820621.1 hypothetical protein [Serratia marcescens]HEJ6926993.1 hypothetical protein [Serratia marcescens]HEJ7071769.1 hypothetical protein [Serratia marcescens]HEJ7076616.1 hypothetical protein [Serratia marcescens]
MVLPCRPPSPQQNILMGKRDLPIIIGILAMLTLWLCALFNIGDITFTITRLFHWIESQRG